MLPLSNQGEPSWCELPQLRKIEIHLLPLIMRIIASFLQICIFIKNLSIKYPTVDFYITDF